MKALVVIESILRNRYQFFVEIREGEHIGTKLRAMLLSSVVLAVVYGADRKSTRLNSSH